MIMTSSAFNEALEGGNRNYQVLASIELLSGETLTLDNTLIWSSGLSLDDSIATTSEALEIGTAIVNKATLVINNMTEQFSAYDFAGAVVTLQVGLKPSASDPVAYINKGTFTVESASYNTTLITLTCIDNMHKFDAAYASSLTFPSTALAVVQDACTVCGVTLGVQSFTGDSTAVIAPPDQAVTYRNMLSWIGQLVGCCWRVNNAGELMPVWYGLSALEQFYDGGTFAYNGAADLDGGTFAYTDGDNVDGGAFSWTGYFTVIHAASADVAVDDTVVTGVKIQVANTEEDASEAYTEYTAGTDGYMLVIADNPLITADNAQAIATTLAGRLAGMKYRKGNVVHVSDPRMEAGDVMVYADHKGHAYPMLVSQVLFTAGEYQTSISASEPPLRNAAQRYSQSMQTGVSTFQAIARERNSREGAIADLEDELANAPGLYQSSESDGQGGTIYYLHDKPTRAASNIIWKMSSSAVGVSTNGGQSWNAGLTADGTAIVQRLYANAITAGILKSADYQYTSGTYTDAGMIVDLDNKTIRAMYAAILGDGKLYASAGAIGAWNIGSTGIYNGKPTLSSNANGAYVGIDGIKLEDADSVKEIATSGGIYLKEKTDGGISTYLSMESYDGFWGTYTPSSVDVRNTSTNDYVSISCGTNWAFGVHIDLRDTNYNWSIGIGDINGCITFNHPADAPLLTNYYNSTIYNILRNHNNGDISVSASSGGLYLGYENTDTINFLNGKATLGSTGLLTVTGQVVSSLASGQAAVYASNSGTGNRIFIYADSSNGQAGLYSYSADNTPRAILVRANNSSVITTYGDWVFSRVVPWKTDIKGTPMISDSADGHRVSLLTCGASGQVGIQGQFGNTGTTYSIGYFNVAASDIRLKKNIKDSTVKALPLINDIKIREFDWKDGRHQTIGMVADELEELDENLTMGGGYTEDGEMSIKSVDTFRLVGYLTKAIQELSAKVEQLEARVKELEEGK